jgi:hypothetical protein
MQRRLPLGVVIDPSRTSSPVRLLTYVRRRGRGPQPRQLPVYGRDQLPVGRIAYILDSLLRLVTAACRSCALPAAPASGQIIDPGAPRSTGITRQRAQFANSTMPRRLTELDESTRKAAAKSAGSRSSVFTGVDWDNDTVSKNFLVLFSILTDV